MDIPQREEVADMIQVDISNVWGQISLPDLLAVEQDTALAHAALPRRRGLTEQELHRIQTAAEGIRGDSALCVAVGRGLGTKAAQAAVSLLAPEHGDILVFAGDSFSTRRWNVLMNTLEGKDFSLIVQPEGDLEAGLTFRELRWMLERKYGTEEAGQRIYLAGDDLESPLEKLARESGWQRFSAAGGTLLTMAAAGIDIGQICQGAEENREDWALRSFENPVWLYCAVRTVLNRRGRNLENLRLSEPEEALGRLWQALFTSEKGALPLVGAAAGGENVFDTVLTFTLPEKPLTLGRDWADPEGLNALEGKTLQEVQEQALQAALEGRIDRGIPVLSMDCGQMDARTFGGLLAFWNLCRGICAGLENPESCRVPEAQESPEQE